MAGLGDASGGRTGAGERTAMRRRDKPAAKAAPEAGRRAPRKGERNPLAKAFRALEWLIDAPGEVGVRQLAAALDMQPSNAHQLLGSLMDQGFVQQNPLTSRYALGPELLRWAQMIMNRSPVPQVAAPHMRALVEACNETALLGLYDAARGEMMFAASVESEHPLRYAIELNAWKPMNTGASSLAILAFLPETELAPIVKRLAKRAPLTPNAITDAAKLHAELRRVRAQGYAFSRGQRLSGAIGFAAPIFGPAGRVVGDVVLTFPEQRYKPAQAPRLVRALRQHAAAITADIGGTAPPTS